MNLKTWTIVIAFLIWGFLSKEWYTCKIKGFCDVNPSKTEASGFPILFNTSSFDAIKGLRFDAYVDSLKSISLNDTLIVKGLYNSSEKNETAFPNLGIARAFDIKCLLAKHMDTTRVILASRLMEYDLPPAPFVSHDISIKTKIDIPVDTTTTVDEVTITKESATITFGSNSSQKDVSPEVDSYLSNLATELKSNGKKITITGHTDNVGDAGRNIELGRIRALAIKRELVEKGVKATQINTDSKGEAEPVADNTTEEGKHRNRRVEITN